MNSKKTMIYDDEFSLELCVLDHSGEENDRELNYFLYDSKITECPIELRRAI